MKHLRELLAMDDSLIAQSLRSTLYGLEDFLKKTPERFPQDPGANICDAVLQELQSFLQLSSPDNPTNQSQNTVASPTKNSCLKGSQLIVPNELKLSTLGNAFYSDSNLINYLGNFQLRSQTDSDLWEEIQYKLLRIPKGIAKSWKEHALELAKDARAEIDTSNSKQLRFIDNRDIYPGLKGSVQVRGISLSKSKDAFLDPDVLQDRKFENFPENLKLLACLVSICIFFIKIEPDLHHALEAVERFDFKPLYSDEKQRKNYIDALKDRLQSVIRAEESGDFLKTLKAWIKIDEAINSLVFMPPADSESWFGELQKESRRMLFEKAKEAKNNGYDVQIRTLAGEYANVHRVSSSYDLRSKVGGTPGYVQVCLRVYARINQEELKGRVIFRIVPT